MDIVVVEFKQNAVTVDERGRCEYAAGRMYSMTVDEAARFVSDDKAVPLRVLASSPNSGTGADGTGTGEQRRRASDGAAPVDGSDGGVLERLAALAPKPAEAAAPETGSVEPAGDTVRSDVSPDVDHHQS